jgi:hypothetical protein
MAEGNKSIWLDTYKKLGAWRGWMEPYMTYKNYYLESGWWTVKKMWEKGMLVEGENPVLVRFEQVAVRECPHAMALRVSGLPGDAPVLLPTDNEYVPRRQLLEHIFDQAHLERRVHHMGNRIILRWPEDLSDTCHYGCQVQDREKWIYIDSLPEAERGKVQDMGHPARLWEGPYEVVLLPRPEEYFDRDLHYERRMPIHVLDNAYSTELYGTLEERRGELLEYAAKRAPGVFADVAKCGLGRWDQIDSARVLSAVGGIDRRQDGSNLDLMGLLGMVYRYAKDAAFPSGLGQAIEECALRFKYWHDEPGGDAMC